MAQNNTRRPTGDVGATQVAEAPNAVATFNKTRLPYADVIEERFGVDRGTWTVLVESIFPNAKTVNAVAMALSYCKARNLDPLKRVVNIVPMWNSAVGKTVETVWPSIAELRTTAHRTGQYAGCDAAEFGPMAEKTFEGMTRGHDSQWLTKKVRYPEWCRYTLYRMVKDVRCQFVGPTVYWEEAYADQAGSGVPNSMWGDERPIGQLDKVAEAAALRRAFPEELGNTYAAEEMEGRTIYGDVVKPAAGENGDAQKATATPAPARLAGPPKAPPPQGNGGSVQGAPAVDQRAGTVAAVAAGGGEGGRDAGGRDQDAPAAATAPDQPPGVGADGRVTDYQAFAEWVQDTLVVCPDASALFEAWQAIVTAWQPHMPPDWFTTLAKIPPTILAEWQAADAPRDG